MTIPAHHLAAPPRPTWSPRLVLAHWLGARLSLLAACGLALGEPEALAGAPFHPTTLACAHLTALGFLVTSIAGAFHAVAPLALRTPLRARGGDWFLLVAILAVASGVAAHLALGTYSGVAWSGGLLVLALLVQVPTWIGELAAARVPLPIRVGAGCAWLALLLAVCLGMALAIDRDAPFLPGGHANALIGHVHLGAAGFAALMAFALGLRLLPMFLPAAPPGPLLSWLAVALTAAGAFGMGATLPLAPALGPVFGVVLATGVLTFLWAALGMLRRGKPAPRDLPRPDPHRLLILAALLSLLATAVLGLLLVTGVVAGPGLQVAYGVLGLLGFLGSLVLGIGSRLLPLVGWHAAWHDGNGTAALPAPPRRVGSRFLSWITVTAWTAGVLLLVIGALASSAATCGAGAGALAIAVVADTANLLRGWRRRHAG